MELYFALKEEADREAVLARMKKRFVMVAENLSFNQISVEPLEKLIERLGIKKIKGKAHP